MYLQADGLEGKAVAQKSRKRIDGGVALEEVAGEVFPQPPDSCEETRLVEFVALGVNQSQKSCRARVELVGQFFKLVTAIKPGGHAYFAPDGEGVEVENASTG